MSELSIFVDESGDFGAQGGHYIVVMVFHDQAKSIKADVERRAKQLTDSGIDPYRAIHSGAAIRSESVYRGIPIEERRREFAYLFAFARKIPVTYQRFVFRKREHTDRMALKAAISRQIGQFLQDNATYFLSFDKVVIYYDNGQAEITDILNMLLNAFFSNIEFRRVFPAQYRLFQIADLYCTLELASIKAATSTLSNSDLRFFDNRRNLRKNYLNQLDRKRFNAKR